MDSDREVNHGLRAECEECGTVRTSRVDSFHTVTSEELADRQGLYCDNCDDQTAHELLEAGGDDG